MSKLKTKEDFIKESKELYGDDSIDYSLVDYKGNKEKVILICKKHGIKYSIRPNNHLAGKQFGCPECKREKLNQIHKKSLDKFIDEVESIYGIGRFDFSKVVYINEKTPICLISNKINKNTGLKYGEFYITPDVLLRGYYIESKYNSIGESIVGTFLETNKIDYIRNFKSTKISGISKNLVFIDFSFEYKNKQYWIEYNGIQHYSFVKYFQTFKDFLDQKRRDDNVKQYCIENGIIFIEIPYTYKTQKEIDDLLTEIILNGNLDFKINIPERE